MLKLQTLRTSIAMSCLKSTSRAFTLSATRQNHHEHEESSPEEHLADNPKYLAVAGLLLATLTGLGFDTYYSKLHGKSYFGQWIHPRSDAQVEKANIEYQDNLNKSADIYEVFFAKPVKSPFRDAPLTQVIPSGSPFNREPGSSLHVAKLGPRREMHRSIFD